MKRFFHLTLIALCFCACSPENDAPQNLLRIKKITFTYGVNGQSGESNFIYDGDALVAIEGDNNVCQYHYANGKLINVSESGVQTDFTYSGSWPSAAIQYTTEQTLGETEYVYINDQLSQTFGYEYTSGSTVTRVYQWAWQSGNLLQRQVAFANGVGNRCEYAYNSKKNPFKYLSKVLRTHAFQEFYDIVGNGEDFCVSKTFFYDDDTDPVLALSYTYEATYNAEDYPVEVNCYRMSDNQLMSTVVIEYEQG